MGTSSLTYQTSHRRTCDVLLLIFRGNLSPRRHECAPSPPRPGETTAHPTGPYLSSELHQSTCPDEIITDTAPDVTLLHGPHLQRSPRFSLHAKEAKPDSLFMDDLPYLLSHSLSCTYLLVTSKGSYSNADTCRLMHFKMIMKIGPELSHKTTSFTRL